MKVIKLDRKGLYGVYCPVYSEALREIGKETPGAAWDPGARAWIGYADAVMVIVSRLRAEHGIKCNVERLPRPPAKASRLPNHLPIATQGRSKEFVLKDYQRFGVDFLIDRGPTGAILADQMSLGKSAQAAIAARAFQHKTLIVCPSYARGVWRRPWDSKFPGELPKWWPKALPVAALEGVTAASRLPTRAQLKIDPERRVYLDRDGNYDGLPRDAVCAVVHYEVVYAWVDAVLAWSRKLGLTLIIDEIHQSGNPTSRMWRALRRLAEVARVRIGLTGTPLQNHPRDLFNVGELVSPGRFSNPHMAGKRLQPRQKLSFFDFGVRHCNPPEAPVWMADLSFKPIGALKIGDRVIGWEYRKSPQAKKHGRQYLCEAEVLNVQRREAPIVKITLASGRVIRCTPNHRWLSGAHWCRKNPWTRPIIGHHLAHVVEQPDKLNPKLVRTAGWVGGIFDGEGSAGVEGGVRISQCPVHNPVVCEKIERSLKALGLAFTRRPDGNGKADHWYIVGGRQAIVDFANWTKPARRHLLVRAALRARFKTPDRIISIEPDGEGEVVALTTSTGNYVVWGYASKNCGGHQVQVSPEKVVYVYDGKTHKDEMAARWDYLALRRTRKQVGLELPPKERQVLEIDVPPSAQIIARAEVFKKSKHARKCLDLAANAKLPKTLELLAGHAKAGLRVVCATHRRNIAEWIAERLGKMKIAASFVHGGVPPRVREGRIDAARELRGTSRGHVLVVTMESTKSAIDLSYADVGVVVEFNWNPMTHLQWESRIHRTGALGKVLIQYVIGRGTTDEIVVAKLLEKMAMVKDFGTGDGEELDEDLDVAAKGADALRELYEEMLKDEEAA